jgi:NTP pyrophosphatase (non-canonical NTP hydrolase)
MKISEFQKEVHAVSVSKGWYEGIDKSNPYVQAAWLANIHGEVSEALECVRNGETELEFEKDGKPVGLPSELADILIRVLVTAENMGIDLENVCIIKNRYNKNRPVKHGGKKL